MVTSKTSNFSYRTSPILITSIFLLSIFTSKAYAYKKVDTCPIVTGLSKTQNLKAGDKIKMLGSGFKPTCSQNCDKAPGESVICNYSLYVIVRNNNDEQRLVTPTWAVKIDNFEDNEITFTFPEVPSGPIYRIFLAGDSQYGFTRMNLSEWYTATVAKTSGSAGGRPSPTSTPKPSPTSTPQTTSPTPFTENIEAVPTNTPSDTMVPQNINTKPAFRNNLTLWLKDFVSELLKLIR